MSKHTNGKIVQIVKEQLDKLEEQFKTDPTLFFTENDLVCTFHRFLYQALKDDAEVTGQNGEQQSLIHCEYPTPFRCRMKGHEFELKDKDTDPEGWTNYKRGHFDIVVLSPEFVRKQFSNAKGNDISFCVIKAQNIAWSEEHVIEKFPKIGPVVLMGIEFVYKRDPITTENAVNSFIDEVCQDLAKLEATCRYPKETRETPRFMKDARMVAFVKGTEPDWQKKIKKRLKNEIHRLRFQGRKKMKLEENRVTIVFDNASCDNDSSN